MPSVPPSPPDLPSMYPSAGPGSSSRRRWFISVSAALLLALLISFRSVLQPFLLGIVVAYVLSPLVNAGQRMRVFGRRPPRWSVVVTLYLALIGALTAFVVLSVPRLGAEISRLAQEGPAVAAKLRNEWLPEFEQWLEHGIARYMNEGQAGALDAAPSVPAVTPTPTPQPTPPPTQKGNPNIVVKPTVAGGYEISLPASGLEVTPYGQGYRILPVSRERRRYNDLADAVREAISRSVDSTEADAVTVLHTAQRVLGTVARSVFGFVLTLMISAYLLLGADRIFEFFRSLYPVHRREQFDDLVRRIDKGLAGVVRGQLLICLINGTLTGIGFYWLGLKYWVFLTLLATVLSIIPIFGVIVSTVPAVLVALPQGMGLAMLVLAWVVLIHQIEANILNPKIMSDAARVHPVLVVFALIAGEQFAGIVGALFAVPVLSIAQTLFLYLRERALGVPRNTSAPPPMQSA